MRSNERSYSCPFPSIPVRQESERLQESMNRVKYSRNNYSESQYLAAAVQEDIP